MRFILVADFGVQQAGALLANHFQHGQHGITMDASEPFNGTDANTLNKQVRDLDGLFQRQAQIVQRLFWNV
jgi:hypothetical protein